ncbi:MAG: hypothetical protein FIA94_00165 [Nitrospirae bacterium]|nr:hypothetical protein [Nitrospirota bacterium]
MIGHQLTTLRIRRAAKRSLLKVAVGAADVRADGWVGTDREHIDLTDRSTWARFFSEGSVDAMVAEHVWEHLTHEDAELAAQNCRHFLKTGGHIRIAVPDGYFPDAQYLEVVRPGGTGPGCEDHKVLYTYRTLCDLFSSQGFEVRLLEYWDEAGIFHTEPWSDVDGLIRRSGKHDPRNSGGRLRYTSLILDAIKR